jgi:hypothetical protein
MELYGGRVNTVVAFIIYAYEEVVMNGWISFIVGLFIGTFGGMVLMGILEMASLKEERREKE